LFFLTAEKKKETIVDCWVFLHNKIMRETISKYVTYYDYLLIDIYISIGLGLSHCVWPKKRLVFYFLYSFLFIVRETAGIFFIIEIWDSWVTQ
jgi:hypothetical protein